MAEAALLSAVCQTLRGARTRIPGRPSRQGPCSAPQVGTERARSVSVHSSAGAGLGWGRRSPPCRAASGDRRHGKCTRGSVMTSGPQGENRVLAKQMGLDLSPSWGRDSALWGGGAVTDREHEPQRLERPAGVGTRRDTEMVRWTLGGGSGAQRAPGPGRGVLTAAAAGRDRPWGKGTPLTWAGVPVSPETQPWTPPLGEDGGPSPAAQPGHVLSAPPTVRHRPPAGGGP